MNKHILIVDNETEVANTVAKFLAVEGFTTEHLQQGNLVESYVAERDPDMLVLDVMLPGKDGIAICRAIREFSDVPIFILTAHGEESQRIVGLEVGADDYIRKPFSALELVSRIKAFFRRFDGNVKQQNIRLHSDTLAVSYKHKQIAVTSSEFALIALLKSQAETALARDSIIEQIYRDSRIVTHRVVDSHVRNLRKKLKTISPGHEFVQSVYGVGYRYMPFVDD